MKTLMAVLVSLLIGVGCGGSSECHMETENDRTFEVCKVTDSDGNVSIKKTEFKHFEDDFEPQ